MKRITALLTAAVLATSCGLGSLPAFAAGTDAAAAAGTAAEETTEETTEEIVLTDGAAAVSSDRIVTLDSGETIVCPDGWDAQDPEWVDAYLQMNDMLEQETQDANSLIVQTFATYTKTTWSKNGGGTLTFYHDSTNCSGKNIVPVIDVSKYQPSIDWDKVKAAGIDYAIIRVGYRGVSDGSLNEDAYYAQHIEDALAAGVQVGVYIYSQAITQNEAIAEANFVLERISGYDIQLPVVMDYEYYSSSGRLYEAGLTKAKMTNIALAFCETVEAAGYDAMLYASSSFLKGSMNGTTFAESYPVWCARYYSYLYKASSSVSTSALYQGDVEMWQCTSSASVSGISGNVDLSYWYQATDWTSGNTGKVFTQRTPTVSTSSVTASSITISWKAISSATEYQIFYTSAELGTWSNVRVTSDQTSYTLSGLNSGQEYYFQVRALNADGDTSQKSSTLSAITSGGGSMTLTVNKAYYIRSAAGSTTKVKKVAKGATVTFLAYVKGPNGGWWYKVKSGSKTGYIPAAKVNVSVAATKNIKRSGGSKKAIKITWTKTSHADSYVILRSTARNGKYEKIATVDASVNTYTDKNLSSGTIYYYKVRTVKNVHGKTYKNTSAVKGLRTNTAGTTTLKTKKAAGIYQYAGTNYKKKITAAKGAKLTSTHVTRDKNGKKWYLVSYKKNGKTYKGYIAAKNVKKTS